MMTRRTWCGHCKSDKVHPHCAGVTPAKCPWIICQVCAHVTDHAGRVYLPRSKEHDDAG